MADSDVQVLVAVDYPKAIRERFAAVSPKLEFSYAKDLSQDGWPEELLETAEILYTSRYLPEPGQVPALRWIQFHKAGIDHVLDHPLMKNEALQFTTMSGASAPQMAEFALMSILALSRRLPRVMEDQRNKHWTSDRFQRYRPSDLRGSTVGIVGYGSVGREVARLVRAFGASVLAVKRDLKHLEDVGYTLDDLGDPSADLPDRIYPPQALGSMVPLCDYVVVATPLTMESRGLVGNLVFQSMKASAYLIDLSRGGVVVHADLITALEEELIAGAALDVFPVEPLPESSRLWELPNVILSPHIAGASIHYWQRAGDLFILNLNRYLSERPLLNEFQPDRLY